MADTLNWWDRLSYSVRRWGNRILDEGGFYDPWEELAKFDDENMTVTDRFGKILNAGAHAVTMPVELVMAGAQEVNRFVGADWAAQRSSPTDRPVNWSDIFTAEGRDRIMHGSGPTYRWDAIGNYFTGGVSPEMERQYREQGMSGEWIRSRYEPASLSDAIVWRADHIRNTQGTAALWNPLSGGWIYGIGSTFNPVTGAQRNGSYLPAAYDILAPDAGAQLWERSDLTHQLIASQVVVETALDPANLYARPVMEAIRGVTRASMRTNQYVKPVDSVTAAESLALVGNVTTDMNRWQRARQWATGRGLWDSERMLTNLARNPQVANFLQQVADTSDVTTLRRLISSEGVATGEGADALATVAAKLDNPQDVASLLYAAAYRDEEAFKRVMAQLDYGVDNLAVSNTFKTMTGTGQNVLESAFFQFGDGPLPEGHLLRTRASQFVDDAIERFDAGAGVEADSPLSIRSQWDALADEVRKAELEELENYQLAMRGAETLMMRSDLGEQVVQALPTRGAKARDRFLTAAQTGTSPNRTTIFLNQLRQSKVPSIMLGGRSMRTTGTVYLMAKPGLSFALHGIDATERFDAIIQYVDGIVGSTVADAPSGRFANLPEVQSLMDQFVTAGAQTMNPEQIRANLVDALQTLAIQKIAEARGVHPEAAKVIADAGMEKSRTITGAMNSLDAGYASTVMEDSRVLILKSHPSTLRQTANHVPIMDLKALDDALKAKGTQSALTVNGRLLSVAEARSAATDLLTAAGQAVRTEEDAGKVLRQLGRSSGVQRVHNMIDVMDEVHTLFKAGVLFRLGYGFRNLSEAHLSAFASGVGWLGVLRHADLPGQLSNFMVNRWNGIPRMIDRRKSLAGLQDDVEAIEYGGNAVRKARDHAADRVARIAATATNEENLQRLVARVADGDEAAAQELRTVLAWRARMTHELTEDMIDRGLIPDQSMADDVMNSAAYYHADVTGQFDDTKPISRPISVVENPVVAQTAVDGAWSAGPAWSPTPQWTPGALTGAQQFPVGTLTPAQRAIVNEVTGSIGSSGGFRVKSGADMDAAMGAIDAEVADLRDRAADLRDLSNRNTLTAKEAERAARAAKQQVVDDAAAAGTLWIADVPDRSVVRGMGTTITKADDGTYVVREDVGWRNDGTVLGTGYPTQLDAKVAVLRGDVRQPGTGMTQYGARFWTKDGRSAYLQKPTTSDPDNLHRLPLNEIVQRSESSPPMGWVWDEAKQDYVRAKIVKMDVLDNGPGGRPVPWESHDLTANAGRGRFDPKAAAQRQERGPVSVHTYEAPKAPPKADGPSMKRQAATLDQRRRALEKARNSLNMQAQWTARQKSLEKAAKTNRVQWRRNPQSDWVDWKPQHTATYRDGFNPEFRTIPGTGSNPRKVKIDAWSPMIDLTDTRVVSAVLENYPGLSRKTLDAAQAGDRAAQEKLLDAFAKEGFYRVKFPDSGAQWNGEHVMIHPDAIGDRAFRRHVEDMFARTASAGTPRNRSLFLSTLTNRQRAALNRAEVGEGTIAQMPAPMQGEDFYVNLDNVLANGGFEGVMEEALGTLNRLNDELATLDVAYISRRKQIAKRAKRHGGRAKQWTFPSQKRYDGKYLIAVDDALHGPNGGAYANVTAGQLSQHLVYAQGAHHADLANDMARAMMDPEEVHPGSPRYWEGMANFLGRHGRDTPGAVTPMGVQTSDIDPVLARAMVTGDREEQIRDTVEWALSTREGRDWVAAMDLEVADSLDEAIHRGVVAKQRRERSIPPAVTRQQRRTVEEANWNQTANGKVILTRAELADVISAQFNFVDNYLPTQRARDLFLSGQATEENLRRAWEAEPWQLRPFNGLLSPTHAEYRKAMKQKRDNQYGISVVTTKLTRMLGKGLESIGTKPETMMARHPVFQQIAYSDLQQRLAFAEATQEGQLGLDQILHLRGLSQKYAVRKMEQTLYTMKTRASVDEFMRFIMPFFPAWKNTVHRWGRFSMENPAGVARIGRIYQTTVGQMPFYDFATGEPVQLDEGADPREVYTLMPGIAAIPFIGRALPDPLREAMRRTKINLGTWDVIFQGEILNPGFGPLVAMGAQEFMDRNQQLYDSPMGRNVIKEWLLPYGPQQTGSKGLDMLYQWLPSAAKPLMNEWLNPNTQMALRNKLGITYVVNGHDMNPDGTYKTQEQIDSEINHAVLVYNLTRTFSYLTSPVATMPVGDQEYYSAQMRSLRETAETEEEAQDLFLERFGSLNFLYTSPTSYNLTGGQSTTAVVENQRSQTELQQEILNRWDSPKALGFFENLSSDGVLMPYDSEAYNPYARNWQMRNAPAGSTENWRGGKELSEYLSGTKVSLGWRYFDEGSDRVDVALASQGFVPGTPEWARERASRMQQVAAYVEQLVPEWGAARGIVDVDRTERNADMFWWAISESEWGKRNANLPIVGMMRDYLAAREYARGQIAARNFSDPRHPNTLTAGDNADIAATLLAKREQYSMSSPTFRQWVDQFFRTDDVGYVEEKIPGMSDVEAIVR